MASIADILAFHRLDRRLYYRLLGLGLLPGLARNIIVLWLWMEFIGVDIILYLKDCNSSSVILRFVREAEAILHVIRQNNSPPVDNEAALPLTASLVSEPLNLRFFYCNREMVVRGITNILDGIGVIIFDDDLNRLFDSHEAARKVAQEQRQSSPAMPKELAKPSNSRIISASEDHRSMFVTFSNGHPLRREKIAEYFTRKWGNCIEGVMIEPTAPGVIPKYGRIVFTSESFINVVLNGGQMAKFTINGREVWGRKCVTGPNR